jgi:hypothetical protein
VPRLADLVEQLVGGHPHEVRVHQLDDRAQDVWEPLLAIANLAGGDWPQRARAAALSLSTGDSREDESRGARLLQDIYDVFTENGTRRYPTADLIAELVKIEESPWGDWFGKTISPQALGKILKPYRIKTMPVWADGEKHRGYKFEQFEDAWRRVLGVEGGRSGRDGREQSPTQNAPTTPTAPTTHHADVEIDWADVQQAALELQRETGQYAHPTSDVIAKAEKRREENGANGRIPLPGDPDYLEHLAAAHRDEHITEAEAKELWRLHRFLEATG